MASNLHHSGVPSACVFASQEDPLTLEAVWCLAFTLWHLMQFEEAGKLVEEAKEKYTNFKAEEGGMEATQGWKASATS